MHPDSHIEEGQLYGACCRSTLVPTTTRQGGQGLWWESAESERVAAGLYADQAGQKQAGRVASSQNGLANHTSAACYRPVPTTPK